MNRASPTPDDLDKVFSQYFKAQLPAKWPEAPIPVHTAPTIPARAGSWRARLTLAASVAALLAIGFGVSYGTSGGTGQPNGGAIDTSKTFAGPRPGGLNEHMPKDVDPMGEKMP